MLKGWNCEPKTEPTPYHLMDSMKFSVDRSQYREDCYVVAGVSKAGSILCFETEDISRTMDTMADWLAS